MRKIWDSSKAGGESAVQRPRRLQIIADRFLDHDARPFPVARQAGMAEKFRDFAEQGRRRGHVEDAMGFGAPFFFQACALVAECLIGRVAFEIALLVVDMRRELVPRLDRRFPEAGELLDAVVQTACASASSLSSTRSTAMIAK